MAKVPNSEKKIAENFNRLIGCAKVTGRQTTDGTAIAYIANVNVSSRSLKTRIEIKIR